MIVIEAIIEQRCLVSRGENAVSAEDDDEFRLFPRNVSLSERAWK